MCGTARSVGRRNLLASLVACISGFEWLSRLEIIFSYVLQTMHDSLDGKIAPSFWKLSIRARTSPVG
jgi:hypothetical protein